MAWKGAEVMRGDNIVPWSEYAKGEWERMEASWTAADPLTVDDEPYTPSVELERQTSRDAVLVCAAGMVIIAVLAWLLGRWSA